MRNNLLSAIPAREFAMIAPHLELMRLRAGDDLYKPGSNHDFAFFPNSGMISLIVELGDGRSLEVGYVGQEGFVGAPATVGIRTTHSRAIVQSPVEAFRIRTEKVRELFSEATQLWRLFLRWQVVCLLQAFQLAACTQFHQIEQRLARWLLVCQRKTGLDRLPFTQEFLATILGVGRPSVSIAAGTLQRTGIIKYGRGTVAILDQRGLEAAACECHRVFLQLEAEAAPPIE